jgi:hypothetical protein
VINDFYPSSLRKGLKALMNKPGALAPSLRRDIETYAASLSVGELRESTIPEELLPYVSKVTLYAYQVTDEDVEWLKKHGYSEDAIFEMTLCASAGASRARFERGMMAIKTWPAGLAERMTDPTTGKPQV